MTCLEVADFLMDYLDSNVSSAQRAVFEEHLAICPSCVSYLRTYHTTVKLGRALSASELASEPPAPEELIQAILVARQVE